jgi:hypothetical protein
LAETANQKTRTPLLPSAPEVSEICQIELDL